MRDRARAAAEERLLDLLLPPLPASSFGPSVDATRRPSREHAVGTRERLREQFRAGRLDDKSVEIEVRDRAGPSFELVQGTSVEEIGVNLRDMLPGMFSGRTRRRRMPVSGGVRAPDAARKRRS